MFRQTLVAPFTLIAVVSAMAQLPDVRRRTIITVAVNHRSFDQAKETFGGYISLSARPCATAIYDVPISFDGAKTTDEALQQHHDEIEKVKKSIEHAAYTNSISRRQSGSAISLGR